MDITQFLNDATAIMQKIGTLAGATLALQAAVGKILLKGKRLLAVLIVHKPPPPPPATQPKPQDKGLQSVEELEPMVTRPDVAVLVDINQRMLPSVRKYLAEKKLDADLIVVTNDPTYGEQPRFLDPDKPEEWEQVVVEFNAVLNKLKATVGKARVHLFLSTPLPLALALGCVMGTVNEGAILYHWQESTYWPVITISRKLKT